MTDLQYSILLRNAKLDAIETLLGTSPRLKIFTGAQPADPETGDSGSELADMTLPSDWLNAASGGTKTLLGTWQDAAATAGGVAGHFRIYTSGLTCHIQGDITATSGGGDLELDNTTIASGQEVNITTFVFTAGNA